MENQLKSSLKQEVTASEVAQVPTNRSIGESQSQNLNLMGTTLPWIAGGFLALALFLWIVNNTLCICNPNEILVLSGRKYKTKDGQELGYRVISGVRTIRIPILENIKRMDLRTMAVPIEISNAYAKGGTPLQIQASATVNNYYLLLTSPLLRFSLTQPLP